jgi:hypothetical protein
MYCPMQLDCKTMTGVTQKCPNLSECMQHSPLNRMTALLTYFLNQGVTPEEVNSEEQPIGFKDVLQAALSLQRVYFTHNSDYENRDAIIFGKPLKWEDIRGGAYSFSELTLQKLEELVNQGFALITARHNDSPYVGEFLTFARNQADRGFNFHFHGYVISPKREDYRISIDGISFHGHCTPELISEFEKFIGIPDDKYIKPDYLFAWWD